MSERHHPERLRLDLAAVVARCPEDWTIAQLTRTVHAEIREYLPAWRVATMVYRRFGAPYGDSPHGLYRFFQERRG